MTHPTPRIYVGCGGTGIDTLRRLNRLLSQDSHWRSQMAENIYYVVIDTDQSDLDRFERAVKLDCGQAAAPKVVTISLGRDYQSIWPILYDKFVEPFEEGGGGDPAGKDRLSEHYWHRNGKPFAAPKVGVLRTGAGQCPPVSYFLAWHHMRGVINFAFNDLVEQIIKRRAHGGVNPLSDVNFHIVAGLAGGTGRGTWELVALYLRELFRKSGGRQVRPFAYLLDATCYRDVYRSDRSQEVQMKTNSLTGLSQLSTWILDRKDDAFYSFRLPSMHAPHDAAQDLIKLDPAHDIAGDRPVQKAFIVCGGNTHATLTNADQYKEMLGAALYTTLYSELADKGLESGQINAPQPVFSLGAATVEVEAVKIRRFLEEQVRADFAARLGDTRWEPTTEVDGTMGRMGLKDTRHKGAGIVARAYDLLASDKKQGPRNRCERLIAYLGDEDPVAEDAVSQARKVVTLDASAAADLVRQAIDALDQHPMDAVEDIYSDVLEQTGSLAAVAKYLTMVAGAVDEFVNQPSTSEELAENFLTHIVELSDRPWHRMGRRFSASELDELKKEFEAQYFKPLAQAVLRDALREQCALWCADIRDLAERARVLGCEAQALEREFKEAAREAANVGEGDDPADKIFFDPKNPIDSLPQAHSSERFHRRVLKPVRPASYLSVVSDGGMSPEMAEALMGAVKAQRGTRDVASLRRFRQDLETLIRRSVSCSPADVKRHFAIRSVAKAHHDAWFEVFDGLRGNEDEFNNLALRFSQFYGFKPVNPGSSDRDFFLFPDSMVTEDAGDELLVRLGRTVALHCQPYWVAHLDEGAETHRQLRLFLPSRDGASEGSSSRYRESVESLCNAGQQGGARVNVQISGNPFVVVAYSQSGVSSFDAVESFNYWKEESAVAENLRRAEKPDGEIVFDDSSTNGGLGYTSPIFVKDEIIAANRWRPWFQPGEDVNSTESERAIKAVAYALMTQPERLQRDWPLPLLTESDNGAFVFTRTELYFDEYDRPSSAIKECLTAPEWRTGDSLGIGLHRVLAVLAGERVAGASVEPEKAMRVRGRILEESSEYWQDFARRKQFARLGRDHADLLEAQARYCRDRADQAEQSGQADDAAAWRRLKDFLANEAAVAREELAGQF